MASFLCPAHLRPAVQALYWFARTGDDIADEGDAPYELRIQTLRAYKADLSAIIKNQSASSEWAGIFQNLALVLQAYPISAQYLVDLLSAFEQDIEYTEKKQLYPNRQALIEYCQLSANPVGRLMLQMNHVQDEAAFILSDKVCTGLQLVNFWQDLSKDLARERNYLPQNELAKRQLIGNAPVTEQLKQEQYHAQWANVIESELIYAVEQLQSGRAVVNYLPTRMAWELRLVIEAALHVAKKIKKMKHQTFLNRPQLKSYDYAAIAIKALIVFFTDAFKK